MHAQCPRCKATINYGQPYCHNCGQAFHYNAAAPQRKTVRTSPVVGVAILGVICLFMLGAIADAVKANSPAKSTTTNRTAAAATRSTYVPPPPPRNDPSISLAEFEQVQMGMSKEQVSRIVGGPGTEVSKSETPDFQGGSIVTTMHSWYGADGFSNMTCMFQQGRLMSKAQLGLR